MSSNIARLRSSIIKSSKLYGFSLNSDSLKYLVEVVVDLAPTERDDALEQVWSSLSKQKVGVGVTTKEHCEQAVLEVTGHGKDGTVKLFEVIDAFDVPRFVYSKERQKFSEASCTLFPEKSEEYSSHYRHRYNCIYQRLLRSPLFMSKSMGTKDSANKFKLKPLEALYGSNLLMEGITVFGMITQLKADVWYLEDLNGAVELDLSKAEYRPGLICDNTFVLCLGTYDNDVLHVAVISLPPPEIASLSRAYFGDTNFFGGELTTCAAANQTLRGLEAENPDAFIVFLSSVHLDDDDVMAKLGTLFTGYSTMPPVAFVMSGPFLTPRVHQEPASKLSECFKSLGKLISSIGDLKEKTRFVFVPAMEDVGSISVYPRPPLSPSVTAPLSKQTATQSFSHSGSYKPGCCASVCTSVERCTSGLFFCRALRIGLCFWRTLNIRVCASGRRCTILYELLESAAQSSTDCWQMLLSQVKSAIFTTNPCRIQYCTKEIVVFREDLIPKMFRCRVNSPKEDLPKHFARTLISSSTLSLLPLSAMPVFWQYDHAMSLYPLPNLVVAADNYYPYTEQHSECTVVNPGSFPGSKFAFKVYYPASDEVEDSEISDNM